MKYQNTVEARFLDRPNRFIAHVKLEGKAETVHVKNTGRCRELLVPGSRVILEKASNPGRKTGYDLISVYKESLGWVNIDSQAPNQVVGEWLAQRGVEHIKPEYTYGRSRIDFYFEEKGQKCLMEVKGVTLEREGVAYFPDAPTERGVKHLRELAAAAGKGFRCFIGFVIQMENIYEVRPNIDTHPEFGKALDEAKAAGVEIVILPCRIQADSIEITAPQTGK